MRLQVTDAAGRSATATQTIVVHHQVATLMEPFPIVRIAGRETAGGVRLTLVTVSAPVSARVTVRLRGTGVRSTSQSRVATATRQSGSPGIAVLSFPRFARSLGAGVRAGNPRHQSGPDRQADAVHAATWEAPQKDRQLPEHGRKADRLPSLMSTHHLDRRRVRPLGQGFEPRRVAISCGAIVLVFAIAFGVGHMRRSAGAVAERTPPPLPAVANPVPAALASAPAIKLAVVRRPPPAPKQTAPAKSSQPAASPTVTPVAPVTSAPTPTPDAGARGPDRDARACAGAEQTRAGGHALARPSLLRRLGLQLGLGDLLRKLGLSMDAPARVVHPLIVVALVLAAVFGYLAGSHRVSSSSGQGAAGPARVATAPGLLLEYPVGWERSSTPKSIPGLELKEAITLSPHGESASGLLSGLLPAGEPAPLPASFLERLSATPHAEVVSLVSAQAYRYSDIGLPGYQGVFDLYAIPSGAGTRLIACFAPQHMTAAGQACERIVANVTLTGTAALTLTPSATYAGALAPVVSALDAARLAARKQLGESASAASVVGPARSLAARYEQAAGTISKLEAPAPAAAAQVELSQALSAASKAYGELAAAAETEGVSAYDAARSRVTGAERAVDRALESLVLVGYGPRLEHPSAPLSRG